jgi:Spy/CpxP family protein refolding chaperone
MTHPAGVVLTAILLTAAAPLHAQPGGPGMMEPGPPPGPPAFLQRVFPPKLVMEHQQELGLEQSQIDAIKEAMRETQQQLVELQWKLDAESEALDRLLSADQVDEKAVLAKLDQVTTIEQQVKKANFGLLVKIKNQLTPAQQAKLRALRPARPPGAPGGPPSPPP